MNVVTIVQARMGSTRLPGKVLLPIGPLPAIGHTVKRCKLAGYPTVLAIPLGPANDPLHAIAHCTVYRDPSAEDNVLARYLNCARAFAADIVVRVTGDCPFVQPGMIRTAVDCLLADPWLQYVSNCYLPNGQRAIATGWDVEAFRATELAHLAEHVTVGMRSGVALLQYHEPYPDSERLPPVALDTPEDYAWFQRVAALIDVTPPHPTVPELLALLETYPELRR